MQDQGRVRVWLRKIEYGGANIGSNTEFAITVNGKTTRVASDIKFGSGKIVDRLLFEQPAQDDQAAVSISVSVVEQDPLVDDAGENGADHLVVKGQPRQALPPLVVSVQELRGVLGSGATARFTFHFEAERLATGTVTACCWNGRTDDTKTLASYYSQSQRHRRMADYLAGACAYFNLQIAVGHALGAIEDGISRPKRRIDGRELPTNWLQLSEVVTKAFIRDYWNRNRATGVPVPETEDILRFDDLNVAAGVWYFESLEAGDFDDDHISHKSVMYKAMQYNWGPALDWPQDKQGCKPEKWRGSFKPSAYAWTLAFLAWGNGYAVPDASYTSQYARYAQLPVSGNRRWAVQAKRLSPLGQLCIQDAELKVPEFTTVHAPRLTPLGRRSLRQPPRERQIVILVRRTENNTDHNHISALAVAMNISKAFRGGIAPMVTADTYFASESMKFANGKKAVCVIVLGREARTDVAQVFPGARAYPSFASWLNGAMTGLLMAPWVRTTVRTTLRFLKKRWRRTRAGTSTPYELCTPSGTIRPEGYLMHVFHMLLPVTLVGRLFLGPLATLHNADQSVSRYTLKQEPVIFHNSIDGFQFEIPAGWTVRAFPEHESLVIYIDRHLGGLEDGLKVRKCPGPAPEDCMGEDGMLATLVQVTDSRMAGFPAKDYLYDRSTVAGTRLWKELVTVLNVKGKTYGVILKIPYPSVEREYLAAHRQIRESFRLIEPSSTLNQTIRGAQSGAPWSVLLGLLREPPSVLFLAPSPAQVSIPLCRFGFVVPEYRLYCNEVCTLV